MEETTFFHEMSNHKEGDGKDEQIGFALHSNFSLNEKEDHQHSSIHEESLPSFHYEECNEDIENYVSVIFKEYFNMHIYDEY